MQTLNLTLAEMELRDTGSMLDEARRGDAGAFGELCRIHEGRLLRQAMTLCGNASLAEDLAQDTLVEAWRCLNRYNGRCQFFTWLSAILLNRHRNALRQQRHMRSSIGPAPDADGCQDSLGQVADHDATPVQAAQNREQAALIRQCIQGLPRKHQEVIVLRFYVDDSLEGIAAALGCSVGTVKSRLFHALEKLRRMNTLNSQFVILKTKN